MELELNKKYVIIDLVNDKVKIYEPLHIIHFTHVIGIIGKERCMGDFCIDKEVYENYKEKPYIRVSAEMMITTPEKQNIFNCLKHLYKPLYISATGWRLSNKISLLKSYKERLKRLKEGNLYDDYDIF